MQHALLISATPGPPELTPCREAGPPQKCTRHAESRGGAGESKRTAAAPPLAFQNDLLAEWRASRSHVPPGFSPCKAEQPLRFPVFETHWELAEQPS
jgi:hypothetical protein